MDDKDLYAGLIRLHIFYHTAEEPIYGGGVMEELRRHGYELSPGTLYPMLHGLERKGYLRSRRAREGNRMRRFYMNTPKGKSALRTGKKKVTEHFGELFEKPT